MTEMDGISMLNSATYKVEHSVTFVLLDDSVLVARRRQRRTADRPPLVAEKCWPLNDILVLDTKDTASAYFPLSHAGVILTEFGSHSHDKRLQDTEQ